MTKTITETTINNNNTIITIEMPTKKHNDKQEVTKITEARK